MSSFRGARRPRSKRGARGELRRDLAFGSTWLFAGFGIACADAPRGGDAEAQTASATSEGESDGGELEPCARRWLDPPRATGRGPQRPVRFVDASALLGGARVYPGTWPASCDLQGSGSLGSPCTQDLQAGGAAAEDLDGDGDFDLMIAVLEGPDLWLRNTLDEGVVGFEPWEAVVDPGPVPFGAWRTSGAVFLDFDRDGDLDAYLSAIGQPFRLLENLGGTPPRFAWRDDPSNMAGSDPHYGYSVGVGDYDADGWPDLYTSEWRAGANLSDAEVHARLLRNTGAGFVDETAAARVFAMGNNAGGIWAFSPSFLDLDEDGAMDLVLVADNRSSRLWFGDGQGAFVDETWAAGFNLERAGMGSAFGDFDGDGHIDIYTTAIFDGPVDTCEQGRCDGGNRLYLNRGPRCLEDRGFALRVHDGGWGWGASAFDMDNDGDLDLVETNGFRTPFGPPGEAFDGKGMRAWVHRGLDARGEPRFEAVHEVTGLADERGQGRGLLTFDYDADGDLDLLIVQNGGPVRLLENVGAEANASVRVRVVDAAGAPVHGARVRFRRSPSDPWQVRVLGLRQGFLGASPKVAHFGVGPAEQALDAAEIEVRLADGIVLRRVGLGGPGVYTLPAPE